MNAADDYGSSCMLCLVTETAGTHFEAVLSHEPLSDPGLKRSRMWRNVFVVLATPLDPGAPFSWTRKAQYVVRVRYRTTHVVVAAFEYVDAEEAAHHLVSLRTRLDEEGTGDFCRALGIAFPGT